MSEGGFSHWKPLDFGAGGLTGSMDADGRIIALNCYDPVHGYVTLTSAQPFPDADRYDAQKVRAYRRSLTLLQGFGLASNTEITGRDSKIWDDMLPVAELRYADGSSATVRTWGAGLVAVQQWETRSSSGFLFRGRLSLQRSAYTQLTEGGVISAPPRRIEIVTHTDGFTLFNPALRRAVAVVGLPDLNGYSFEGGDDVSLEIPVPSGSTSLIYAFGDSIEDAQASARAAARQDTPFETIYSKNRIELDHRLYLHASPDRISTRGLIYGHQMCVPVGEGICILTDHMLLPLSWNRDAYFVATALLHGVSDGPDLVRRHLIWMFEIAERPNGDWARCYLANGRIKDKAFQLDQQLYPVLELADYVVKTGDRALFERLKPLAAAILDGLGRHKEATHQLYSTDETPGDDPIAQPYHLSSHILLWRTLARWAEVSGDEKAADWARRVRSDIETYFITHAAAGRTLYAYAADARGGYHLYYDANDLPTALAPAWGFCPAESRTWRNTIDFAFSPDNEACFDGRLGSVHTRAPWALGDLQDVVIARALKDRPREERAWERLRHGAAIDGALPEAYDGGTGAVVSRTWFAWPNATAACIQLGVWD